LFNRFDAIKHDWVEAYMNKDDLAGFSINKVVSASDEWCAEAYLETDYSQMSDANFEAEIKKFTASQIVKGVI
jgi:hypothetical protein